MNSGLVANRYALALMAFAQQQGVLDRVHADVLALQKALADELAHAGDDGILAASVETLSPEMRQFLRVVATNGRADCLPAMLRQFVRHFNQTKGIATASLQTAAPSPSLEREEVGTAAPLPSLKTRLVELLREMGYAEVDITTSVNPDLLGGFILQIEDQRLDASLASQLSAVRKELEERNRRII